MKFSGECFFLVVCISAIICVAYWNGFGSYLTINSGYYWFQDVLFGNTTTNLGQKYNKSTRFKNSTLKFNNLLNKSTSVKDNITWYITAASVHQGRLGNIMFKYASLLGLALAQGREMAVFPGSELEKTFNVHHVFYNETVTNWTHLNESSPVTFDTNLTTLPLLNIQINGFLQSFLYFWDINDIIREEFTFKTSFSNEAAAIVNDIRAKYRPSLIVGVHVRRGDFIRAAQHYGFAAPQKSYFLKAFNWMRSSFAGRNITFVVASDDMPWCKANLAGKDVVLMPNAASAVHMAVLASSDHMIISGGSFGWWAGWLAGGKVIYYTGYMAEGTDLGKQLTRKHYYPRLWIGMGD